MNKMKSNLLKADTRWAQVMAKDGAADGAFFYAVITTGIYCKPSCPSRRANAANVRFYDTAAQAQAAGYRACLRCKPEENSLQTQNAKKIAQACRWMEQQAQPPSLAEVAQVAGLSSHYFHRLFKKMMGVTPNAYAQAHRAGKVRHELANSPTVTQAVYNAGFNSSGLFYEKSNNILGMTPTDYRAGGTNMRIQFAVGECSLGSILVAESSKGVCAILMGDEPEALIRDLENRFPRAELLGGDAEFDFRVAQVVGAVEKPGTSMDLPLDIRGTAFQQRVWQVLKKIPIGQILTYTQVAQAMGVPKAVRAVASACAANALAVLIPCHRVVRSDGALAGYRWGIERKRLLIESESKIN
jgi:AraC family transcriptional regulator, regulatory protein of adaptative response / methylated-DNA-[protein]-cysteine methyltransferase